MVKSENINDKIIDVISNNENSEKLSDSIRLFIP